MSVYTVHVQPEDHLGAKARFVREGFSGWALVFGPFWLMFHRLWLALAGWLVIVSLAAGVAQFMHLDPAISSLLAELASLFIALEGNQLRRMTLEISGWPMVDVVSAPTLESAEHAFYQRWQGQSASFVRASSGMPGGASQILGLFPQKGA